MDSPQHLHAAGARRNAGVHRSREPYDVVGIGGQVELGDILHQPVDSQALAGSWLWRAQPTQEQKSKPVTS